MLGDWKLTDLAYLSMSMRSSLVDDLSIFGKCHSMSTKHTQTCNLSCLYSTILLGFNILLKENILQNFRVKYSFTCLTYPNQNWIYEHNDSVACR